MGVAVLRDHAHNMAGILNDIDLELPGSSSVCIECGEYSSSSVFKVYSAGSIQLSQCVSDINFTDQ